MNVYMRIIINNKNENNIGNKVLRISRILKMFLISKTLKYNSYEFCKIKPAIIFWEKQKIIF